MPYVFTKDLETGEAQIDSQHKELFRIMNELEDASKNGKGRDELEHTLKFLSDYIVKHFADEQMLHIKHAYHERSDHKQYHEAFKKSVNDMIAEYRKQGASITLLGEINSKVAMWLLNHIKREDKKFGAYLKEKNA